MARRKIRTNPEILHDAIVDGINVYIREVLLGRGILDERRLEDWTGQELDDLKHEVATRIAGQWETCEVDEKA